MDFFLLLLLLQNTAVLGDILYVNTPVKKGYTVIPICSKLISYYFRYEFAAKCIFRKRLNYTSEFLLLLNLSVGCNILAKRNSNLWLTPWHCPAPRVWMCGPHTCCAAVGAGTQPELTHWPHTQFYQCPLTYSSPPLAPLLGLHQAQKNLTEMIAGPRSLRCIFTHTSFLSLDLISVDHYFHA